jgi:hypothetical protein
MAIASSSCVSSTLRVAMSGGVFRWLQISAGRDFERRAQVCSNFIQRDSLRSQDLAYRLFLTSLRKGTSPQKYTLFEHPAELTTHWDSIMTEATDHFQRRFFSLIEMCEASCDQIIVGSRNHPGYSNPSGNFRRSREFEGISPEMGIQKYAIEQEDQFSLLGSQVISSLQTLQFVGSEIFQDPLTQAMKISIPTRFEPSGDSIVYELQQTYCGFGLHYHAQNPEILICRMTSQAATTIKTRGVESRAVTQDREDQDETEVRQKYIKLLKDGMHKKATDLKKIEQPTRRGRKEEVRTRHFETPKSSDNVLRPHLTMEQDVNEKYRSPVPLERSFDRDIKPKVLAQEATRVAPEPTPSTMVPSEGSLSSILQTLSQATGADEIAREIFPLISSSHLTTEDKEIIAVTLLSSPSLTNLLLTSPTLRGSINSVPTSLCSPSNEWSASLFQISKLPLPDAVSAALRNLSLEPTDTLPTEILGAPPLPLAPFPVLSQLNMKSLSHLFDDLLKEAEIIASKTHSLWTKRKNLLIGGEKVKGQIEKEQSAAASHLCQLMLSLQEEQSKLNHLMQWVTMTSLSKQRTETQVKQNRVMSSEVENLEADCDSLFNNTKIEVSRKEEIAGTTEEGLNLFSSRFHIARSDCGSLSDERGDLPLQRNSREHSFTALVRIAPTLFEFAASSDISQTINFS